MRPRFIAGAASLVQLECSVILRDKNTPGAPSGLSGVVHRRPRGNVPAATAFYAPHPSIESNCAAAPPPAVALKLAPAIPQLVLLPSVNVAVWAVVTLSASSLASAIEFVAPLG